VGVDDVEREGEREGEARRERSIVSPAFPARSAAIQW